MDDGGRANYANDRNLRRRAALLAFALEPDSPQPTLPDLLTWPRGADVLDLGCGFGLWLTTLENRGCSPVGLDRSLGMLTAARDAGRRAPLVHGDAQALPFRDDSFDGVLCAWMLYHLRDKAAALREVARVLRPGGHVVAATNSGETIGALDAVFRDAVHEVTGRSGEWFPRIDFTLENGAAILGEVFPTVTTHRAETPYAVDDPDAIVGYAASLVDGVRTVVGELDEAAFLTSVERRVRALLEDGPVRFTRKVGLFVASM